MGVVLGGDSSWLEGAEEWFVKGFASVRGEAEVEGGVELVFDLEEAGLPVQAQQTATKPENRHQ